MRLEAKKVQIDQYEYTLGYWPVDKSAEMWAWIITSFGPVFNSIYQGTEKVAEMKTDTEMGLHFLEIVSKGIAHVVDPKEYARKLKEICSDILVNNAVVNYQNHFGGHLLHLHKVVFEVLKFQYQDFLDVALAYRK